MVVLKAVRERMISDARSESFEGSPDEILHTGQSLSHQLIEDGFHAATVETEVAQGGQRIRTGGIVSARKFISASHSGAGQ